MMLIADIAPRAALRFGANSIFSYRVPERLTKQISAGSLVWVSLRGRRVQGVVVALRPAQGDGELGLRDVLDLGDPEARIPPLGLQLAAWVAQTYYAPLAEALALSLPPGSSQQAEQTWRASPQGLNADLGALPERERAILYLLRQRGELRERELRKVLRGSDADLRAAYTWLEERQLLLGGMALSRPNARPRREPTVRLIMPPDEYDASRAELQRAPNQQALLAALIARAEQHGHAEDLLSRPLLRELNLTTPVLRQLEERGFVALGVREVRRNPLAGDGIAPDLPPQLSQAQARALEPLIAAIDASVAGAVAAPIFLLHGVTGSGKTELYLRAIARTLRHQRQILVLVPEIALTEQLVRRFAARFPEQLAVLHSGLSAGERYDEWRRLRRGEARIAIGSRSALFAPLLDLGLVIVDEEHELSYKHDGVPRYHARDGAVQLGRLARCPVILGSATPSVESYYAARAGRYELIELHERIGGEPGPDGRLRRVELPLPPVRLIDMRKELQAGNRSIFSRALHEGLGHVLERDQQAILFLNRRGAASFVMCRDCGHVVECPECSSPLTLHYDGDEPPSDLRGTLLLCHSCSYRELPPTICPACLSPRIRPFGIGTQRIVDEVARLFPAARILRWDRDTVQGKGAHRRLLDQFLRREADVLVGTQMIAKGLDLPHVSLVGIVAADMGLGLPDFRTGERAFQLLTQVAGRAGRRSLGAQVVMQSYQPEHYALQAAREHDYAAFYQQEIAYRRRLGYPPFGRLVRFVYASESEATAQREAERLGRKLIQQLDERGLSSWGVIGPAPAYINRLRGSWRWHLLLRFPHEAPTLLAGILNALGGLPGWSIDIDPAHVL